MSIQNNGVPFMHVTSQSIRNGFRIVDDQLKVKRSGRLAREADRLAGVARSTGQPAELVLRTDQVCEIIDVIVDTFGTLPKVRAYLRLFCQDVARQAAGFTGIPDPVYY